MFSVVDHHSFICSKHKSLHCRNILGAQTLLQHEEQQWWKNWQPAEEKSGKTEKRNFFTLTKGKGALRFSAEDLMNGKGGQL